MSSSPPTGANNAGLSNVNQAQYLDDPQYEVRVAGRFKMGKKIGSGSFGEIFLAVDLNTNKEVAIKFVRSKLLNTKDLCRNPRKYVDLSLLKRLNY
jgi:serine/threonine protein kinase